MNNRYKCTAKPSPHDVRDHILENIHQSDLVRSKRNILPDKLLLGLNPSRDQGRRGTCVACSCSAIKEYQERIDSNYHGYFSPDSIYFFRSNKHEEGMFLREALDLLLKQGACIEQYFPYNGMVEPTEIPQEALQNMADFKIKEYAQVKTIAGLKEALCFYGPCLIAFPVYDGNPEFWRASSPNAVMNGGHAVTVVGYNERGFIIRNSWGADWNQGCPDCPAGCVIYPYDEWGVHWECWSTIDEESVTKF